ncbi:MAG: BrnT family toxin [Steroidobacteraceae bacterium]
MHYEPEFDPEKNAANIAKHGVSLADGDGVLLDPLAVTIEDSAALDELRWITVGANSLGLLMVVVWTERGEEIRLISVRPATPKERRAYEKRI